MHNGVLYCLSWFQIDNVHDYGAQMMQTFADFFRVFQGFSHDPSLGNALTASQID